MDDADGRGQSEYAEYWNTRWPSARRRGRVRRRPTSQARRYSRRGDRCAPTSTACTAHARGPLGATHGIDLRAATLLGRPRRCSPPVSSSACTRLHWITRATACWRPRALQLEHDGVDRDRVVIVYGLCSTSCACTTRVWDFSRLLFARPPPRRPPDDPADEIRPLLRPRRGGGVGGGGGLGGWGVAGVGVGRGVWVGGRGTRDLIGEHIIARATTRLPRPRSPRRSRPPRAGSGVRRAGQRARPAAPAREDLSPRPRAADHAYSDATKTRCFAATLAARAWPAGIAPSRSCLRPRAAGSSTTSSSSTTATHASRPRV